MARSELPCAATRVDLAGAAGPGTISSYQYGSARTSTSFRHSVCGRASVGSAA